MHFSPYKPYRGDLPTKARHIALFFFLHCFFVPVFVPENLSLQGLARNNERFFLAPQLSHRIRASGFPRLKWGACASLSHRKVSTLDLSIFLKAGLWLITRGFSSHCDTFGKIPLLNKVVFGKPLLLYHRSGFHSPQPCFKGTTEICLTTLRRLGSLKAEMIAQLHAWHKDLQARNEEWTRRWRLNVEL